MATTSSTSTTTTTTVTINRPPAAPVVPKRPPCDSRRCCCRETSLMHPTYAFPLSIPNSQRYEFSLFCDAHVRTLMSEHLAVIPLPPTEPRLEHAFFMFAIWTLCIIVLAFFEQWGFFEWAPDANPFDGRTWSNEGGRTWCVYFTIVLYVWLRTPNVWPRLRWGDLRRQYCRFFFVWGLGHMTICLPFAVKLAVRFVWQTMPLLTLEVLTDVWYIGMLEVMIFLTSVSMALLSVYSYVLCVMAMEMRLQTRDKGTAAAFLAKVAELRKNGDDGAEFFGRCVHGRDRNAEIRTKPEVV